MSTPGEFATGLTEGASRGMKEALRSKRAPLAFATIIFAFVFWLAMNNRVTIYADLARRPREVKK